MLDFVQRPKSALLNKSFQLYKNSKVQNTKVLNILGSSFVEKTKKYKAAALLEGVKITKNTKVQNIWAAAALLQRGAKKL